MTPPPHTPLGRHPTWADIPPGRHPLGQTPSGRHPPARDPPETATAANGTHPTGMHSCLPVLSFDKEALGVQTVNCIVDMQKREKCCGVKFYQKLCFSVENIYSKQDGNFAV